MTGELLIDIAITQEQKTNITFLHSFSKYNNIG